MTLIPKDTLMGALIQRSAAAVDAQTPSPGVIPRLGNPDDSHLYEIDIGNGLRVQVDANNRNQAARIAERNGYAVRSVNMIG